MLHAHLESVSRTVFYRTVEQYKFRRPDGWRDGNQALSLIRLTLEDSIKAGVDVEDNASRTTHEYRVQYVHAKSKLSLCAIPAKPQNVGTVRDTTGQCYRALTQIDTSIS